MYDRPDIQNSINPLKRQENVVYCSRLLQTIALHYFRI